MFIVGVLIVIIILIFGVVIFGGKKVKEMPVSNETAESKSQRYIDATTANQEYSITDPNIQKLNKSTSGSSGSLTSSANREAWVRATSASN